MTPPFIQSVQVGLPRLHGVAGSTDPHDKPWATAFFKGPVAGPVAVTPTGLVGDGQSDLVNHGGIDKAVLAYSADHYDGWRDELGLAELPGGAFGENLTVAGLTEDGVCVGDVFHCGDVTLEVSQPRQPCWKLARRWRIKDLPARVVKSGRCGWYLRVTQTGTLAAGDAFTLLARPNPAWTIRRAHRIMHFAKTDAAESLSLAAVPGLSFDWQETLRSRG